MSAYARILVSMVVLTIPLGVAGQEIEWTTQFASTRPADDLGYDVDADGNAYVVGHVYYGALPGQTNKGGSDAFIRKYGPNGAEIWTRQFGTESFDFGLGVSVNSTGIYVAGYTHAAFPDQAEAGGTDAYIRKYDADGNVVWTRQFGTPEDDVASAICIDSSGLYVTGWTLGSLPGQTNEGSYDAYVSRYDIDGNHVWTRQFGSADYDNGRAISVDSSGVYVVGRTRLALPGQTTSGLSDAFVRKYDIDGNEVWTDQFGTESHDVPEGITVGSSGVFVAGWTGATLPGETSQGGIDAFIRKYDTDGNEVWTQQFGGGSSDYLIGICVSTEGVYASGYTYGTLPGQTSDGGVDAFVCKYDIDGAEIWTRQFGSGSTDFGRGISVDSTGVYMAGETAGELPGQTSEGLRDIFVRKYDHDGVEIWTDQFGSAVQAQEIGLCVDADGDVFMGGHCDGALPGRTYSGRLDAFLRKYDSDGNEVWTRQFGTGGDDNLHKVLVDATGVYVVGSVWGTLPGQTSAGHYDAFVRKYDRDGNEVWTDQFGTSSGDTTTGISADATGLYVSGITDGSSSLPGQTHSGGQQDAFVRKYDFDGNVLWTRQFGTSENERAYDVSVYDGGVFVGGFTLGSLPGQSSVGNYDAFVRKYDTDGNEIWTRQFGSSGADIGYAVSASASGIYLAGTTWGALPDQTYSGGGDAFIRQYDSNGDPVWTKQFSAGWNVSVEAWGIEADASGVFLTGYTYGALPGQDHLGHADAYIRRYDSAGGEIWTRQFGTSAYDRALGVGVDTSGIYVAGQTRGTFPGQEDTESYDAFLAKFVVPDIEAAPATIDFGFVAEGASTTAVVTISNVGTGDLEVTGIYLSPETSEFSITVVPTLPVTIAPGGTEDVEITFAPLAEGTYTASLEVISDDPAQDLAEVSLIGTGVPAEVPPEDQIAAILAFFDESVANETLWGDGPGKSAAGRRGALRNMLEAAGDLIEDDLYGDACEQLQDALNRTDGEARPPEFVAGPNAAELADRIQTLMDTLGCQE